MKAKRIFLILSASFMVTASADVGSALVDYYNSMEANTKIERASLTTNGATFGGYYQRGANVDMTLGYITPPSIKGGCGNIDFNMGAFSFISGDQIVAALKAIGQNAKALLFTEAIDIVSGMLGGNIKMWIDQANKWLGILKNSCQASSMLMGGINHAAGLCQNTERFKSGLSDENTVQSTCQTASQGMSDLKSLWSGTATSEDDKNAKNAMAAQFTIDGGILQNILSEYFNNTGKQNEMQAELGNLVISAVGDVYSPPIDKNTSNDQAKADAIAIPPVFTMSDIMAYSITNAKSQESQNAKKIYNCDFTWDKDNFRAKNVCFNEATKKYQTSDAKSIGGLQILLYNKISKIHNSLLSGTGEITDNDLTVLSLADAPIFQLMQAGIDLDMDSYTMTIINKWMDYSVHRMYQRLFTDLSMAVSNKVATLKANVDPTQMGRLDGVVNSFSQAQSVIKAQVDKDVSENKLNPQEVLDALTKLRAAIIAYASPELQQQVSFSSQFRSN